MLSVKILYPPTEHIAKLLTELVNVLRLRLSVKKNPPNNGIRIMLTRN